MFQLGEKSHNAIEKGLRDVVKKKKDAKVGHCPVLGGGGVRPGDGVSLFFGHFYEMLNLFVLACNTK